MTRLSIIAVSVLMASLLVANAGCMRCGKAATERIAESMAEKAINTASGGKANVDVGSNVDISGLPVELRPPNATAKGRFSITSEKGTGNSYTFETNDPIPTVVDFYKKSLATWKQAAIMETDNGTTMIFTTQEEKVSATVNVSSSEGKTAVTVLYATK